MTRDEVIKLLAWAVANFPSMQERDLRPTAELWYKILGDLPYEIAEAALIKVLATAKYFPTVAEIREAAASIALPSLLSPADAWNVLTAAINRYGFYRRQEALASLPPEVRKAVECLGWESVCHSEEPEIVRAQFMRVYETYLNRAKEEVTVPPEVRALAERLLEQHALPEGGMTALPSGE